MSIILATVSVDKDVRTNGIDWFEDESLGNQIQYIIDFSQKIDIVVSHTAPDFIVNKMDKYVFEKDPSCEILTFIYNTFKPSEWVYGHWHEEYEFIVDDCKFTCKPPFSL